MGIESNAEAFLLAFHARHAGATAQTLRAGRTGEGHSSYDLLARLVPPTAEPVTIVDLACGDGYLLELLRDRGLPNARLIGIDMSEEELKAARARLGPDGAELLRERAQRLPLPDSSVDYLLSHMALMLMDDVDEVVREVGRVLKPGGVFCAVVGGEPPAHGAYGAFHSTLREALAGRPQPPLALGDPRTQSAAGLRALFGPEAGFAEPVHVEDVLLHVDGPTEQVRQLLTATYWSSLLSAEEWAEVFRQVEPHLAALCREDGTVPCAMGLRLCHGRVG
jgi:SAM-dependent methyltransferase